MQPFWPKRDDRHELVSEPLTPWCSRLAGDTVREALYASFDVMAQLADHLATPKSELLVQGWYFDNLIPLSANVLQPLAVSNIIHG